MRTLPKIGAFCCLICGLADAVNSIQDENSVSISPDETYLLFTRYQKAEIRPDKIETDFYISYRLKRVPPSSR